jgi:hypothetical protein
VLGIGYYWLIPACGAFELRRRPLPHLRVTLCSAARGLLRAASALNRCSVAHVRLPLCSDAMDCRAVCKLRGSGGHPASCGRRGRRGPLLRSFRPTPTPSALDSIE